MSKFVLRKIINNKLPREVVWRKDKKGFLNHLFQNQSNFYRKNTFIQKDKKISNKLIKYPDFINKFFNNSKIIVYQNKINKDFIAISKAINKIYNEILIIDEFFLKKLIINSLTKDENKNIMKIYKKSKKDMIKNIKLNTNQII